MAERQRSGVTEAFSRSGRCRGRAIVRLLRAVLVALLNVVRVDSPGTFGTVLEFRGHHRRCRRRRRRPGVGWALATVTPATDRTGGERRAHRGHDLVLPIHLVDPLSRGSADWPLSPPCPSGPVTSLSLPENIFRYYGSAVTGPREAPRVSVVPPRRAPVSLAALHLDVEWVLSGTQQVHSGRGRRAS